MRWLDKLLPHLYGPVFLGNLFALPVSISVTSKKTMGLCLVFATKTTPKYMIIKYSSFIFRDMWRILQKINQTVLIYTKQCKLQTLCIVSFSIDYFLNSRFSNETISIKNVIFELGNKMKYSILPKIKLVMRVLPLLVGQSLSLVKDLLWSQRITRSWRNYSTGT